VTLLRLGIVASHPIQYQVPLYRALSMVDGVDVTVLFLTRHGAVASVDHEFGLEMQFDVPLLEGYRHRFLLNVSPRPDPRGFFGSVNPGLMREYGFRAKADVVLVHGWFALSHWLAFAAASASQTPILLRGDSNAEAELSLSRVKRYVKQRVLGSLLRHVACCVAIGYLNREFYRLYGVSDDRIGWAPYSVDNERFVRGGVIGAESRVARLKGLGLDPTKPTVLFAGKLQPWKRPEDLLRAVSYSDLEMNVLIIGDGPLRRGLESKYGGDARIRFLGFVNQLEISQWYGASDMYVLPSSREQWGLGVNEAMAAGAVPVVSSAVGCRYDLIGPDCGRIFEVGDVEHLRATLRALGARPRLRREMRHAAMRRVRSYSIERTADGIVSAATAALGTHHRRFRK